MWSVAWIRPSVSFQTSHASIVPNASSLRWERRAREQPLELAGREVRVGHEPGPRAHEVAGQLGATLGRPPILPDDRARDRSRGAALPQHGRLALVRDPDRLQLLRGDARRRDGVARGLDDAAPDLVGIVLDPPGLREVGLERPLAAAQDGEALVDDQARGARRPLVDCEDHAALITREVIPPGARAAAGQLAPGHGVLAVARVAGRSVVVERRAASPLRLLCPSNAGVAAWTYTSTFGGGLVDGDDVHLGVTVGDRAQALLATQASTKAYRGPARGAPACRGDGRCARAARRDLGSAGAVRGRADRCAARCRARRRRLAGGGRGARGRSGRERRALGGGTLPDPLARAGAKARCCSTTPCCSIPRRATSRRAWGRSTRGRTSCSSGPAVRDAASALLTRPRSPHRLAEGVPALELAVPLDGGCLLRIAAASTAILNARVREALACVGPLLGDDPFTRRW